MSNVALSPKQHEIVFFEEGAILVEASAGSGKTRVLTERIKRLLQKTRRKILAITFTNKAGEEMKERLGNITDLNERLFVGTFHGFCQYILENRWKSVGFPIIPHIFNDQDDRLKLIEQAIRQTPCYQQQYEKQDAKSQKDFCTKALTLISEVKRNLLNEDELLRERNNPDLVLLYSTYQDLLNAQNAIDFDDLIRFAYNLFIQNPAIAALFRRTYEYICIDEAQDLNYAQYQFLRALTGTEHQNIMMVGDPNQSIFAFNGSSSEYMTRMFVEDFHPKIIELKENYRSSKRVLSAAQKIIPDSCDIINTVKEGIFEMYQMEDEESEAKWIVAKIQELVKLRIHDDIEDGITYEKIAVLGRNKYVFNPLVETLNENNIPYYYKITPGAVEFESSLMKIFDMAFRVKLNPQDTLHWYRLLELCKNSEIQNLTALAKCLANDIQKEVLNTILNLREDGSNFKASLEKLLNKISDENTIEDENEKRMIINDINELLGHWREYAKKTDRRSLLQFKNSMALGKTHPLTQKKGVTLSTVHTMKGQEYDIIFLMGMDDDTFPDYRAVKKGGTEMVQEKNNAYVAFTRAKRFLYVTWPSRRLMPWGDYNFRRKSRFLKDFESTQSSQAAIPVEF